MGKAKSGPEPKSGSSDSDLIDKEISFDTREMHKTWPLVKGCLLLLVALTAFVYVSYLIFKAVDFNKLLS